MQYFNLLFNICPCKEFIPDPYALPAGRWISGNRINVYSTAAREYKASKINSRNYRVLSDDLIVPGEMPGTIKE